MKIEVVKENCLFIGAVDKESQKKNLYAIMTIADVEGNIHKVYVKEELIGEIMPLNQRDFIKKMHLEVRYNGKNLGVSLIDIEL